MKVTIVIEGEGVIIGDKPEGHALADAIRALSIIGPVTVKTDASSAPCFTCKNGSRGLPGNPPCRDCGRVPVSSGACTHQHVTGGVGKKCVRPKGHAGQHDDGDGPMSSETVSETCDRPPAGWACTRPRGHEGPCAAVPRDVVVVSDPSAGPRDNYKGEAEELVGWLLRELETMVSAADATRMVAHVREILGKRAAKAEWGEALEETDSQRAFRVVEILVGDEDIVLGEGSRATLETRLRDEFAEVRAVDMHDAVRKEIPYIPDMTPRFKPVMWPGPEIGSLDFELEKHRKAIESITGNCQPPSEMTLTPRESSRLVQAVQFLLAVAHQPVPGGVVEVGGSSPAHEYTVSTLDATKRALGELEMLRELERVVRAWDPGTKTKMRAALNLIDAWRKDQR